MRKNAPRKEKECVVCGKVYIPNSGCSKTCSKECSKVWSRKRALERWYANGRKQSMNRGKGYNQSGENNNNYKDGVSDYSKKAFEHYPNICVRCNSTESLLVHHKDHNRRNGDINNLEILCKRCHQEHHCIRDEETGRYLPHEKV